jgi:hypothetical protein
MSSHKICLVFIGQTLVVIVENFENAALTDEAMGTAINHRPEFVAQSDKAVYTTLDISKMRTGDLVGFCARLLRMSS